MTERVLVLVAHPDDETLGCGATIAKHAAAGDTVSIVCFADGLASRGGVNAANIQKRHGAARRAMKILGTEDVWLHQYADNMMDNLPLLDVVQHIEKHLDRFKPTVVYTHWHGDLNIDHQVMSRAVAVACRPYPGQAVKRVLMFEVPSSTEWGLGGFSPNWFESVAMEAVEAKMKAWDQYADEQRLWPHTRSNQAVANLLATRGAAVGVPAAEAFVLARNLA